MAKFDIMSTLFVGSSAVDMIMKPIDEQRAFVKEAKAAKFNNTVSRLNEQKQYATGDAIIDSLVNQQNRKIDNKIDEEHNKYYGKEYK